MSNETKVMTARERRESLGMIPNEVVIVGKLRDEKDTKEIDLTLSKEEILNEIFKKFKFIRETNLSKEAIEIGFQSGPFFHIQMGDPGGEMITLPNGQKRRRSRQTTQPGWDTIFKASRITTFEEIKEELLGKRIDPVGGDPNSGKIRLTEYALMGLWDEFPVGFWYTPHFYDPKQGGKLVPLMAHPKQPDGTYSKKGEPVVTNTARHFVYEDEIDNIEVLREAIRTRIKKAKWVVETADNKKDAGIVVDDSKPATEQKDETKKKEDDL